MIEPGYAIERMSGQRFCVSSARRCFQVGPRSIHQMVLTLERPAQPGLVRTINVLVRPERVPFLRPLNRPNPLCRGTRGRARWSNLRSRPLVVSAGSYSAGSCAATRDLASCLCRSPCRRRHPLMPITPIARLDSWKPTFGTDGPVLCLRILCLW